MMDHKQALEALLAKVEAGGISIDFTRGAIDEQFWPMVADAFFGSLDAALLLHSALLGDGYTQTPGYKACVWMSGSASVWDVISNAHEQGAANTPARAWLIAILKALIAREAE